MDLWLDVDSRAYRADAIVQYSLYIMATHYSTYPVIEVFIFVVEELARHLRIFSKVTHESCCVLLFLLLKDEVGWLILFVWDAFDSRPAADDGGPTDDRVHHH